MNSNDRWNCERVRDLMSKARMGWWEANFTTQNYVCSAFIIDLLGLGEDGIISFIDFRQLIRADFREQTVNEFSFGKIQNVYDQVYPLDLPRGLTWLRVKLCSKELDEQGNLHTYGFMECMDTPVKMDSEESALERVNRLFSQQNSIFRSLLSLLRSGDMGMVIKKILGDIMQYYPGGCIYIIEYDWKRKTQTCRHEAGNYGSFRKIDYMDNFPMGDIPWWTRQLAECALPVILVSLDELPPEARVEKERLARQGVKSTMVVPMISRDGVWGYAGIDIMDKQHVWRNEDYQWFSSLVNVISICMVFRKEEEKALEEKSYLDGLYKHMPVGCVRMKVSRDEQGRVVDYYFMDSNDMAHKLYGLSGNGWVGKYGSEVDVHIKERLLELEIVMQTNAPREVNYYLEQTGKYCHSIMYSPRKDEVVLLFSDMTETFAAHAALDRSERILRNIYKNLPVGIELYDKEGYLIDTNDKELEIFGLNCKEDILGVNLFDTPMVSEEMKDKIRHREIINIPVLYDFSKLNGYYRSTKKGIINLLFKVTMLYDVKGELTNYLLINIDRTEATEASNQIQEFKNFFTLVGDYAQVGYAHFDALSREGYALDSWYRNVGERQGTPLSRIIGVYSRFHPDDRAVMIHFLEEVVRGAAFSLQRDVRVCQEDGRHTWTRVNMLVRDYRPWDGVIEMLGIDYDITELKNTEEKLIESRDKAEESDRLKSAFLANMSHEIRTPLNAIVGFSNLLAEVDDETEKKQYISIVEENNMLLLQLISDILDLSKIEAGTFEMVYDDVNVCQLCEDVVTSLQMKVPVDVKLWFNDRQALPCHLFSDRNRIHQVISNFVTNAFKFTSSGTIEVGYVVREGEVEFYVSDTGSGIAYEKQQQIFERFVKLNSFVHGTGLGLSICKSIVEQLGGRIGVTSVPGEGSRFWFTLPRTK